MAIKSLLSSFSWSIFAAMLMWRQTEAPVDSWLNRIIQSRGKTGKDTVQIYWSKQVGRYWFVLNKWLFEQI